MMDDLTFQPLTYEQKVARSRYGICPTCDADLNPVWFTDYDERGREWKRVDYLLCDNCGERVCVDDSFDRCMGPTYNTRIFE